MNNWCIELSEQAENDLDEFDRPVRREILVKLKWLAENFDSVTPFPLHGSWKGFFKFRIGDWRILYAVEIKKQVIKIYYIDHRNKIYRCRR